MTGAIETWAALEMAAWDGFVMDGQELADALRAIARERQSVFLFHIDDGRVTCEDKSSGYDRPPMGEHRAALLHRADWYARFLSDALTAFGVKGRATIAFELEDLGGQRFSVPVFAFQKRRGANTILLPDIDLVENQFYIDPAYRDTLPYDEKRPAAIFVGSTTGDPVITAAHVRQGRNARLRSATFFRDNPDVVFDLPAIVQFDTPETRAMIEALGVQGKRRDWQEQHGYRYLLSMDGNGATCSRVYLSLGGNGVLVKYNSPYLLYYFHGLEPWRHYIPVMDDADVLTLLAERDRHDALHRAIAERSRAFARDHLSRPQMWRYTARVLSSYMARFGEGASDGVELAPLIDLRAHISNRGEVWAAARDWVGDGRNPLEAITLVPDAKIAATDLGYCVAGPEGVLGRPVPAHEMAGSHGTGRPLHGLQIRLKGKAADTYALTSEICFADGTHTGPRPEGEFVLGSAPLAGLRLTVRPR